MAHDFAPADQAQYFYDERGQLIAVIDSTGAAAIYNYDPVGNLLAIQRFMVQTSGIGIFLLTPASALVGTNVTIQGFGFSATPGDNQVQFNGVAATVVSATTQSLVATVPAGATTGPVTVTNANGTATSPAAFTVLVPPIISGIDPAAVAQGTTAQVVLAGFNLTTVTAVTFTQPGLSATILAGGTATSLPLNVTATGSVPVGTYPFTVSSALGSVQSGTVTVAVRPALPSFAAGSGVSAVLPLPSPVLPQGDTLSLTPVVSVSMP